MDPTNEENMIITFGNRVDAEKVSVWTITSASVGLECRSWGLECGSWGLEYGSWGLECRSVEG